MKVICRKYYYGQERTTENIEKEEVLQTKYINEVDSLLHDFYRECGYMVDDIEVVLSFDEPWEYENLLLGLNN